MSKSKGKYWSVPALKARGWTNELMKKLLPRPHVSSVNGARLWRRTDVLEAEHDPQFLAESRGLKVFTVTEDARSAVERAAEALKASWDAAEKPEGLTALLAGRYHEVLMNHVPAAAEGRMLHAGQVNGYIGQFLSLARRCDPAKLPGELSRFLMTVRWLGEHLTEPLAADVVRRYPEVLLFAAKAVIDDFTASHTEADAAKFLTADKFPVQQLLSQTVAAIYAVWYIPRAIRTSLSLLVALNPKDEYPEARAMRRRFVIHIGGTNTGKTYAGFRRLMEVPTGVYLAPLRLLALEAQETLLDAGVDCSLTTGEEEDWRESDTHVAATAEKLDLKARYDVAVIDECQMIADPQRGYAWTRAILGVLAPEVHLCAAPEAKNILIRLIESCGDTYEIELHQRKTPLVCLNRTVDYTRIQPGDALITFSKIGVLSVAEDLRQEGKEPAIIYGALPYSTRRMQMEGFLTGKMQYVVSTDAIGMGLNLPIRRIIFMDTEKFDGVERRELKPSEIQQIAGRAGRYGMYEKGYVSATQNLAFIRAGLSTVVPPIQKAVVGFSDLVLEMDFDLLEVLTEWNKMPTIEPYVKLDITRYITVISKMRETGFTLTKEQELRAANIPFDETEDVLLELFFHFLRQRAQGEEPDMPELTEGTAHTLPELELYYRKLDLYFSFAKAFDIAVDEDRLYESREAVAAEINEILLHRLRNNIRFCSRCGKALPLHYHGRLCEACYRKTRRPAR